MSEVTYVNVGIPAYNEGANINRLLHQVLDQKEVDFVLNKIFVISDGSSDNTVEEVKKISDSRIVLVDHKDRKGKAARFQELLQLSESDILVQFDADIKLEDNLVIHHLVKEVVKGNDLVFSRIAPVRPRTYIEKAASFGIYAWEKVLDQMDPESTILHRCQGRCRAFSKKFYKNFALPVAADSVEDLYSFCYAITHDFKPAYAPNALIRFRLPATKKDFIKQTRRFVKGSEALTQFFGKDLVSRYTPTERMKLVALFKSFFHFLPHIPIGYIILQMYARKTATMENQKPIYDYVGSTKKLE